MGGKENRKLKWKLSFFEIVLFGSRVLGLGLGLSVSG